VRSANRATTTTAPPPLPSGPPPAVGGALAGEAGQFPALDVADPHGVGVTEVLGEPLGPGRLIGGTVEAAGEQGGGAGYVCRVARRSLFRCRNNRDHVHDKITATSAAVCARGFAAALLRVTLLAKGETPDRLGARMRDTRRVTDSAHISRSRTGDGLPAAHIPLAEQ